MLFFNIGELCISLNIQYIRFLLKFKI